MSLELRQTVIGKGINRPFSAAAKHVDEFVDFVDYLFRDDPNYVRPLDYEVKGRLSPKNPFFDHAEGVIFTARRDGKVVGRCTAQIDREHLARYRDDVGFFGFFDTINDPVVAGELLAQATRWLGEKGMKTARGPLSLNINEEVGCLVEGFDTPPMLLMPHHKPYQGALIEGAGFHQVKDALAWRYTVGEVPARARRAAEAVEAMPEVTYRTADPKHFERDIRLIMEVFNDAWSDNWGFVPLTESELRKTASDMRLLVIRELTCIVSVDGEPVGVAVAMPNVNKLIGDFGGKLSPVTVAKLLWRLKVESPDQARMIILGIRKKLRHNRRYAGLSTFMYVKSNDAARKIGVRTGELSWTLEDNGPVNVGIRLMGGKVYKRYRVYEKAVG